MHRIPPFRDGARDATQFDVALSPDGRQVAWVELRMNVVFNTIDYRRYAARVDGSAARQVAASGGRPFVAWASPSITLREGLTIETDEQQTGELVDAGLCTASPSSAQNGTCRGPGSRQLAFDPLGRHLRHPDVLGNRLVATAYAYEGEPDNATQRPGSIALFDTSTARHVRDLTSATTDLSPVLSPDGRRVAFERRGSVFTVRASGGPVRRLLANAARAVLVSLSRRGQPPSQRFGFSTIIWSSWSSVIPRSLSVGMTDSNRNVIDQSGTSLAFR